MERIIESCNNGEWSYQAIEYTVDGRTFYGVRHMVRNHRVALYPAKVNTEICAVEQMNADCAKGF